uniref:RNA-directed RNA polymerase n=1 Tax=Rice ragged stunt virus TaxID=42475 RepID=F4YTS9_RRSV|nr:RNA-dependent RNA polymerase [Rice ragged stunt virus]
MTLLVITEQTIHSLCLDHGETNQIIAEIKQLEKPELLFSYITDAEPLATGEVFVGPDICGNCITHTFRVPDYVAKPPPYDSKRVYYPYSYTCLGFDSHPYDYLLTLDTKSIFQAIRKITLTRKLSIATQSDLDLIILKKLTTQSNCQSRVSSIWRQCVAACLAFEPQIQNNNSTQSSNLNNLVKRMFATLLKPIGRLPFYERRRNFVWEEEVSCPTILPLLLYSIQNLVTQFCAGVINRMEMILAFQYYLDCGVTAYQDEKLRLQKLIRNWLREGLAKFSKIAMPNWTVSGVISCTTVKPIMITTHEAREIKSAREAREANVPTYLLQYINHAIHKAISPYQTHQYWQATRVFANDGTYFASVAALTLNKAVRPRIEETTVKYPNSRYLTMNKEHIAVTLPNETDTNFGLACQFVKQFIPRLVTRLRNTNFQEEFIAFLTSSSSGKDFEDAAIATMTRTIQRVAKKRIVAAGLESRSYLNQQFIADECLAAAKLVGRTQIGRRQRAIAGVNNTRSLLGFPPMLMLKALLDMTGTTSSGKQMGNYLDLLIPLGLSPYANVIFNSADVDAMDASVQASVQQIMWHFVVYIALQLERTDYFAFTSGDEVIYELVEGKDSVATSIHMSGLARSCLRAMHLLQPQNCVLNDDIVGELVTREPTFPSGQPFTTVHHTFTLSNAIMGGTLRVTNLTNQPSTLLNLTVQGDDTRTINYGPKGCIEKCIDDQSSFVSDWGFKVSNETSSHTSEYLQQRVSCGTFVGYPDRVSLFAAERPKEGKTMKEKMSEIWSLVTDLGCRSRDPQRLVRLMYAIGVACCCRLTIRTERLVAEEFIASEVGRACCAEILVPKVAARADRGVMLRYHYPISALWLEEGGQLPPLATKRRDGTWTCFPSYYFQRGDSNRYWYWDVSLTEEKWITTVEMRSDWDSNNAIELIDDEILEAYATRYALAALGLNKTRQMERLRLSEESTIFDVEQLASGLNAYRNLSKIAISHRASERLKNAGVELPDSVLYSRHTQSRIQDAILKAQMTEKEEIEMSLYFFKDKGYLRSLRELVKSKSGDLAMIHRCEWGERVTILESSIFDVVSTTPLSMEVYPGSIMSFILCYTGLKGAHSGQLAGLVGLLQGKYGGGKISELQFSIAKKIYLTKPYLLNEFIIACGLGGEAELALKNALHAFEMLRGVEFSTVHTPRQFFFGVDSGVTLGNHLDYPNGFPGTRIELAAHLLLAMNFLSSNAQSCTGRSIRVRVPRGMWSRCTNF